MKLPTLIKTKFIAREKRFFANCLLEDGTEITAHCANTGSLRGVLDRTPAFAYVHHNPSPTRKLAYSLELMELADGTLTGVHTGRTNPLAAEWLTAHYPGHTLKPEAAYDNFTQEEMAESKDAKTRFDFLLTDDKGARTWVEVKTVTCIDDNGNSMFPDAVSTRGQKHLHTLIHATQNGDSALQLYMVMRDDTKAFRPATEIDPTYAQAFREAQKAGVHILALQHKITPSGIIFTKKLPVLV